MYVVDARLLKTLYDKLRFICRVCVPLHMVRPRLILDYDDLARMIDGRIIARGSVRAVDAAFTVSFRLNCAQSMRDDTFSLTFLDL